MNAEKDPLMERAIAITTRLTELNEEKHDLRAELGEMLERHHLPMFLQLWAASAAQEAEDYSDIAEAVIQEVGPENVAPPPDNPNQPVLRLLKGGLKE